MYCWIEPRCGCSICIGPPRETLPQLVSRGLRPGANLCRRSSPYPYPLPALLSEESKNQKKFLVGYLLNQLGRRHSHIPVGHFLTNHPTLADNECEKTAPLQGRRSRRVTLNALRSKLCRLSSRLSRLSSRLNR